MYGILIHDMYTTISTYVQCIMTYMYMQYNQFHVHNSTMSYYCTYIHVHVKSIYLWETAAVDDPML